MGRDDGGSVDGDVDDEEASVSVVFVIAGRVELSTEAGMDDPFGVTIITMDVEACTTVVGVGSEAGALTMNVVVCTGVPVVRTVEPSWSSLNPSAARNGWAIPAPGDGGPKSSRMSTSRPGCRFSGYARTAGREGDMRYGKEGQNGQRGV
jgi:hypothetical protein